MQKVLVIKTEANRQVYLTLLMTSSLVPLSFLVKIGEGHSRNVSVNSGK